MPLNPLEEAKLQFFNYVLPDVSCGENPFVAETKNEWLGKPSRGDLELLKHPVPYVFCSLHTNSHSCVDEEECRGIVRVMQHIHINYENLPDIRFNFLIGKTSATLEGRGWQKIPDLPEKLAKYNSKSIYIGFIGPAPGEDIHLAPGGGITNRMREAQERLLRFGVQNNFISKRFLLFYLIWGKRKPGEQF